MVSIQEKKTLILTYEKSFADRVALAVIDKPELNIWMILIPVVFVHYFYRLKKFNDGRKAFAQNFLLTRERSLEEAFKSITEGVEPDIGKLVNLSSAPKKSHDEYRTWLKVLLDHYRDLIRSTGDDFESMIRSLYKTRSNYLLYINQLNRVEKNFNTKLKPSLRKTNEDVNNIVNLMEKRCVELRREEAEKFFP